jgi:heme exporter protein D
LPVVLVQLRDRLLVNLRRQLDRQARLEAGKATRRA